MSMSVLPTEKRTRKQTNFGYRKVYGSFFLPRHFRRSERNYWLPARGERDLGIEGLSY